MCIQDVPFELDSLELGKHILEYRWQDAVRPGGWNIPLRNERAEMPGFGMFVLFIITVGLVAKLSEIVTKLGLARRINVVGCRAQILIEELVRIESEAYGNTPPSTPEITNLRIVHESRVIAKTKGIVWDLNLFARTLEIMYVRGGSNHRIKLDLSHEATLKDIRALQEIVLFKRDGQVDDIVDL